MTDSPRSFRSRATVAIELLKHARTEWVTRPALARELNVKVDTVNRWVAEFVANGVLFERMRKHEGQCGSAPMEYRLAPEWGGVVEPPPPAAKPKPVVVIVAEPELEDTEPLPADPKWPSFNSVRPGVNPDTGSAWAAVGEPA